MAHGMDRLAEAVAQKQTPVLVGLDPRYELLPEPLGSAGPAEDAAKARAYREFCQGVIDVVAPLVPAVKPQAAFFEELGPPGMEALAEVIGYARERDLFVILDGKRNDIGSTAEAYARAYLGPQSAWKADALTVNAYLGDDGILPFDEVARQRAAALFVLVKTSNPGGKLFQDRQLEDRPLYAAMGDFVEDLARRSQGKSGYGVAGAVVGATYPDQLRELRARLPHTWFLVPGFGAQGGTAEDVAGAFDARGLGAVVNNSRGILFAHRHPPYREQFGARRWQDAVAAATREMIDQLSSATNAGQLKAHHEVR